MSTDGVSIRSGTVPREYLGLLYLFMHKYDGALRDAVVDHLCEGVSQSDAAEAHDVHRPLIARQVSRLRELHERVKNASVYVNMRSSDLCPGEVSSELTLSLYAFMHKGDGAVRRAVMDYLAEGMTQTQAADKHKIAQPRIANHLRRLRGIYQILIECLPYLDVHQER